jgi:putative transposase
MVDPQDEVFSLRQQCGLLGLNRSGLYYQPVGESERNLGLMRLLDEQYTRTPYYGVLRMVAYLRSLGHEVNQTGQAFAAHDGAGGGIPEAGHQQA